MLMMDWLQDTETEERTSSAVTCDRESRYLDHCL